MVGSLRYCSGQCLKFHSSAPRGQGPVFSGWRCSWSQTPPTEWYQSNFLSSVSVVGLFDGWLSPGLWILMTFRSLTENFLVKELVRKREKRALPNIDDKWQKCSTTAGPFGRNLACLQSWIGSAAHKRLLNRYSNLLLGSWSMCLYMCKCVC